MGRRAKRQGRSDAELLQRLQDHLSLLREYVDNYGAEHDRRYLGEIAGKLRLLVTRGRQNRPLLIDLMTKFGSRLMVVPFHPFDTAPRSLAAFLDELAVAVRDETDVLHRFTGAELIGAWAQQTGAAHEDWEQDRGLLTALNIPVYVLGDQVTANSLLGLAKTVLSIGEGFLQDLRPAVPK